MFKIITFGLVILFLIGFNSCKYLYKIPKNPKSISIEWHKSGGMLPSYSKVYISNDSCIWINYNEISLHRTVFELSQSEILDLYSTFYNNNFTKIKYFKQEVQDRAGSDIYITIDNITYQLLNSGSHVIQDKFTTNYKVIEQAIIQKYEDANKGKNKDVKIDLSPSITDSKYNVVLYIDRKEVYNEQKSGEFIPIDHTIQNEGIHFKILLMKKSTSPFQTVISKYELTLNKLPSNKDIILILDDGNLILK